MGVRVFSSQQLQRIRYIPLYEKIDLNFHRQVSHWRRRIFMQFNNISGEFHTGQFDGFQNFY